MWPTPYWAPHAFWSPLSHGLLPTSPNYSSLASGFLRQSCPMTALLRAGAEDETWLVLVLLPSQNSRAAGEEEMPRRRRWTLVFTPSTWQWWQFGIKLVAAHPSVRCSLGAGCEHLGFVLQARWELEVQPGSAVTPCCTLKGLEKAKPAKTPAILGCFQSRSSTGGIWKCLCFSFPAARGIKAQSLCCKLFWKLFNGDGVLSCSDIS